MSNRDRLKMTLPVTMSNQRQTTEFGTDPKARREKFCIESPAVHECDRYSMKIGRFRCEIKRQMRGALCGYVGLPAGVGFEALAIHKLEMALSCHGGITYTEKTLSNCSSDDVILWVGFDCAHSDDLHAIFDADRIFSKNAKYRTVTYVIQELHDLVAQLEGLYELLN